MDKNRTRVFDKSYRYYRKLIKLKITPKFAKNTVNG